MNLADTHSKSILGRNVVEGRFEFAKSSLIDDIGNYLRNTYGINSNLLLLLFIIYYWIFNEDDNFLLIFTLIGGHVNQQPNH
jgi:hypothetical protein